MKMKIKDMVLMVVLLVICIVSFVVGILLKESPIGIVLVLTGLILFAFVFKIGFSYTEGSLPDDDKTQ